MFCNKKYLQKYCIFVYCTIEVATSLYCRRANGLNWLIAVKKLKQNHKLLNYLFSMYYLYRISGVTFKTHLALACERCKISFDDFLVSMNPYSQVLDALEKDLESQAQASTPNRNKKLHFEMNRGTIKFSTIHSFKGLECSCVFLIINESSSNDELLYTGLTRCRNNLVIVNLGNHEYHDKLTAILPA